MSRSWITLPHIKYNEKYKHSKYLNRIEITYEQYINSKKIKCEENQDNSTELTELTRYMLYGCCIHTAIIGLLITSLIFIYSIILN